MYRTRLLGRLSDCSHLIRLIIKDLDQYPGYTEIAFGDNPADIPDLPTTLAKIEGLSTSFSDYDQETGMDKLTEAMDHIEKIHALMRTIAAKSPAIKQSD